MEITIRVQLHKDQEPREAKIEIESELFRKLIMEICKACEHAFRRGYQQGWEAYRRQSRKVSAKRLDEMTSEVYRWRKSGDFDRSPTPPGMYKTIPKPKGIKGTAFRRHISEFRESSPWLSQLVRETLFHR